MTEQTETINNKTQGSLKLDNLEVELHFDLGQSMIPLSELLQTQVGQFINLSTSIDNPVTLRINQQKIGKGKIFIVDHKIAIQVTEFTTHYLINSSKK